MVIQPVSLVSPSHPINKVPFTSVDYNPELMVWVKMFTPL